MPTKLSLTTWLMEAEENALSFGAWCLSRQSLDLECSEEELLSRSGALLDVMRASIDTGLSGVRSVGGLVGGDSRRLQQETPSCAGSPLRKALMYALAVGEANAAMGRIVAAPTAGASGVLPALLFTLQEEHALTRPQLAKALITAGSIGLVIASRATLAGATGGCQAECGSAAAMAAGAAVDALGGSPRQVGHAVAIALKNMLGLVCDPVAGLVEVPCVKRNAGAAANALAAAEMALADIASVIPPDEVIDTMGRIGAQLPCSLRETAQGGLATTPSGLAWAEAILGKNR